MTNSQSDDSVGREYDETPYPSAAYPQTHPDHMAVIGTLFGMCPRPVSTCRVLELGCSDGGNLIPMAVNLPEAEFVGVDIAARHVATGRQLIDQLSLKNIRLLHQSILDIDSTLGVFDYIIAHGVFSWVPQPVQEKLLEICRRQLAPQGIAFVSYNTYPGWHIRGMLRDMMRYHTSRFENSSEQIRQARALVQFLANEVPTKDNPYGLLLKDALDEVRSSSDSYLRHESLEEVNEPLYFHQFAARAKSYDLQYLGESEFHTMLVDNLSANVSNTLERLVTDQIDMEQYMDFVRNRTFRQTLLCHRDVSLNRNIDAKRVSGLHVASPLKPTVLHDAAQSETNERFLHPSSGQVVAARGRFLGAALTELSRIWPDSLAFEELTDRAGPESVPRDVRELQKLLLHAYAKNLIVLHVNRPRMSSAVGPRPLANPLARLQAITKTRITTQLHDQVELDGMHRHLLALLDGTRDHDALAESLAEQIFRGDLEIQQRDEILQDAARIRAMIASQIAPCLGRMAESALLIG